ncbi:MAG TPA: TonB family protein [Polyangiaceae bacterium]
MRRALFAFVVLATILLARSAAAQQEGEITHPVVVHQVDAVYPESMAPQHADVILLVTLDADGKVTDVRIANSGGAAFDEAAVLAVHQWTFSPATRNGKPFAARIKIPFHFAPPPPVAPTPPPVTTAPPPTAAPPQPVAVKAPAASHPQAAHDDIEDVRIWAPPPLPRVGIGDVHFDIGKLRLAHESPTTNASQLLQSATPILLTNEGGEGHAEQVFLRGFDAREGQDIEFSVDGVPINESGNLHGNGYADTHFIIPELVQSLRVVEGPFDPRQGNYAVAGSADFQLGLPQRGFTMKYTGGSWNTQRGLILYGPEGMSDRTFAGAEIYSTDGFGQNRDALHGSAMGQYEGRLGERGAYHLTAQAYATHFHSAGLVRQDDFQSGRVGFYDSYDLSSFAHEAVPEGGDATRFSIAGDVETRQGDTTLEQQVFLIKRDMRLLENFTGFLLDVQEPLQSLHGQRGDELDMNSDELTMGARGFARIKARLFKQPQELELGYFARGDVVHGTQQRLEAATGIPYRTDTDLQSTLADIGLYADANIHLLHWLALRGGFRSDVFTFDVLDNCAAQSVAHPSTTNPPIDESCLTQRDFGIHREANQRTTTASIATMPRGSIILGPFEGFSFSGSVGSGVRSVDPGYVTQNVSTPFASVLAWEGGAGYTHALGERTLLVARSVFFQTHVDKDLIFSETEGRNVIGVGTTRSGWLGAARLQSEHVFGSEVSFDQSVNLTLVSSTYDDTHELVEYVPGVVLRSDTAVYGDLPIKIAGRKIKASVGAGVTYVGPRPLPFGQRSDDLFTLDATLSFAWRNVEVGVTGTNITNNQYRLGEYNFASDFHSQAQPTLVPERMFSAGPPLGVFGSLTLRFGGKS